MHPDTQVTVEGEIPGWEQMKAELLRISSYIPQVIYLGYDVVITDDGFKIIEINSHQAIHMIQTRTPLLKDALTRDFFAGLHPPPR